MPSYTYSNLNYNNPLKHDQVTKLWLLFNEYLYETCICLCTNSNSIILKFIQKLSNNDKVMACIRSNQWEESELAASASLGRGLPRRGRSVTRGLILEVLYQYCQQCHQWGSMSRLLLLFYKFLGGLPRRGWSVTRGLILEDFYQYCQYCHQWGSISISPILIHKFLGDLPRRGRGVTRSRVVGVG